MKGSGSDTERLHKMLAMWLDLDRALQEARSSREAVAPWNSQDPRVIELWNAITHPKNLRTLEMWFFYLCSDSQLEHWTQVAIQECRRRAEKSSG